MQIQSTDQTETFTPQTDRELTALYLGEWFGKAHERADISSLRAVAGQDVVTYATYPEDYEWDIDEIAQHDAVLAFVAWCDEQEAALENEIDQALEDLVRDGFIEQTGDGVDAKYRATAAGVAEAVRMISEIGGEA